jgi:glycosidase
MYDNMNFNYIAYNTIRMYDTRYANAKNINKPLWNKIINIIPSYQQKYGVDGVMIDMGHALPPDLLKKIQKKARTINPYFAFWEENFSLTHKSVEQGYNVTLGYLWSDEHYPERLKKLFNLLSDEGMPLPFFASPETHNTPRAILRNGGLNYSLFALYVNAFLPAIFFIHSGYELCVDYPVNTGLDFSNEEQKKYPSEELPLFSESSFDWNNKKRFVHEVAKVSQIREKYIDIVSDNNKESFRVLESENPNILGFIRVKGKKKIFVIANSNFEKSEKASLYLTEKNITDLFSNKKISVTRSEIKLTLRPGEVRALKAV